MSDGAEALEAKRRVQPCASVHRFPVEGGLLLLDTRSSRLFAYNDTARHVWDLLESGRVADDLVSEFAQAWGIPSSLARRDIDAILAQWRLQGLLAGSEEQTAPFAPTSGHSNGADRSGPALRRAAEWICTMGRTTIAFAVENELLGPTRVMLAHLETPGARPQARIEISKGEGDARALLLDGVERLRTRDDGILIGGLWQTMLELMHPDIDWLVLIHGGAVARKGEGIVLCGPSGSGKSTLTAGLVSAGFDYLADDLVAVSAPDGKIVPWPVPLSVKPGSFAAIAPRHPQLAQAPRYRTKGMDARLLVPPPAAWDVAAAPVRCLVFPRFAAGAKADMQRISTFQAIERLLSDRVWIGYPIVADRVAALLKWMEGRPAYAATYGSLDDAMRLIEGVA